MLPHQLRVSLLLLCVGCTPPFEPAAGPKTVVIDVAAPASIATGSGVLIERHEELAGRYASRHQVTYVCENPDWCQKEVSDTLMIEQKTADISVEIELVQTNFHICTWSGVLTTRPDDGGWEFVEPGCHLILTSTPNELSLSSEGCRDYCGVRASLQARFPRSSRASNPPSRRD